MIRLQKDTLFKTLLFLFVVCIPLSWASFFAGSVYRTLTIVLVGIFLLINGKRVVLPMENAKLLFLWLAFVLYIALSLLWAENFSRARLDFFGHVLVFAIVIIFAAHGADSDDIRWMDQAWLIAGVVCAVCVLFGAQQTISEYTSRITFVIFGTDTDPNEFGGALIVPVSLSVHYFLRSERVSQKLLHVLLILIELYVILLTGSRGALAAAMISAAITACMSIRLSIKSMLLVLLMVLASVSVFMRTILPAIPEDIVQRLSLAEIVEDGGSRRVDIWVEANTRFFEGPALRILFGYGEGGTIVLSNAGTVIAMHNQFLQIMVNYGVIGLILYLSVLLEVSVKLIRMNKKYFGPLVGMIVLSMTLSMPPSYKPLWIILMAGFVHAQNAKSTGCGGSR